MNMSQVQVPVGPLVSEKREPDTRLANPQRRGMSRVGSAPLVTAIAASLVLGACAKEASSAPADTGLDTPETDTTIEVDSTEGDTSGHDTNEGDTTTPFVYPTACDVGQASRPDPEIKLVDAFPTLSFELPIVMGHANDGTKRLFVGERAGRIKVIRPGQGGAAPTMVTALDIASKVYPSFECGFLGLALHPDHKTRKTLYTDYCIRRANQTFSVISEWKMSSTDPDLVDPTSERVLFEVRQPFDNHNGGALAFGKDGFLYISFGDGGGGNDPVNSGQDKRQMLGKILRIDVDDPGTAQRPYGIPSDNPFADGVEGRAEVFALGMRNPWRMSFDRMTGEFWVADVGQDAWEEVNLVERGKNYGWKIMEASICRPGGGNCDTSGLELPIIEYGRDLGRSITGGYVYRGTKVPSLIGAYVFADYASRGVFTWRKGDPKVLTQTFMTSPGSVASFGEDEDGEIYLIELETSKIRKFEEGLGTPSTPPPGRLSQTGCFADLSAMTPATGILPYSPQWPFWSDGADKARWVVLPQGGKVTPTPAADGAWRFPVGTVFIKHFDLEQVGGKKKLETRFLIQEELGVRGFTYRWNAAQTDADLLDTAQRMDVTTAAGTYAWHFPSPTECTTCHRGSGVLGLDGYQLDEEKAQWQSLGLLTATPPNDVLHPTPTSAASAADKARTWLHVNCAYCHDGGGPSGTPLNLERDTPLAATQACDLPPVRGAAGVTPENEARLIAPGSAARSVVVARSQRRDNLMMPPLGTSIVDPQLDLVRDWIGSLSSCQ